MISLLCLHRFLLDKGLVDFIVVMHNRYTVQCKLHRFIFNFLLVRTTSHQIVSRYCCALKPSLRIFATVDYRKNKFVSWLENFVIRLSFVRSFFFFHLTMRNHSLGSSCYVSSLSCRDWKSVFVSSFNVQLLHSCSLN